MKDIKYKILIIGAKGMLGQELRREFENYDYEVAAWDKEEIDITKKEEANKTITDLKPKIIINAAACNEVDKIEQEEKEKELAEVINGYAVGYLSEAAVKVGAIFIHYSTDYVFDGEKIDGYKEDDKPNPQSVYGYSKWLGEQMLLNKSEIRNPKFETNSKFQIANLKYYLIRTSRLFGKAAMSEDAKKSFVDIMLKLADEKDELELVDEEMSSPTYVLDLARRTREIVEWKKPYGIYHVANSGACTWYGWAKKIFEFSGKNVRLIPVKADKFPRPAKRPKYSVLLNTKLPPMRRWERALKDYLKLININIK